MVGPTVPDDEGVRMTRVAAIDCGTNSIRLLVAEVDPDTGALRDLDRRMEIVRLGQDVDRTGTLAEEALQRTFAAAEVYADACRELGAERTRFVATSATRDASNRQVFVDGIMERLGVEPEVVSGAEEAGLSFAGATGELIASAAPTPFLVVDIGGGSTEVVRGGAAVEASRSVDIGCVRLTERHLHSDPPTDDEIAAACVDIQAGLDAVEAEVALEGIGTVVGLAGSVTTIAAHAMALERYDPARIHGVHLPVADVVTACDDLLCMNREWRKALPYMHPGRVDIIGAGALIWREVIGRLVRRSGIREVRISEHDILDGIALSIA
jgi:exopolyphosphatase / guanosine-5'-triphosphate,3'-diphosphate pyrophosphatase